jgi:hypothetical protein
MWWCGALLRGNNAQGKGPTFDSPKSVGLSQALAIDKLISQSREARRLSLVREQHAWDAGFGCADENCDLQGMLGAQIP